MESDQRSSVRYIHTVLYHGDTTKVLYDACILGAYTPDSFLASGMALTIRRYSPPELYLCSFGMAPDFLFFLF